MSLFSFPEKTLDHSRFESEDLEIIRPANNGNDLLTLQYSPERKLLIPTQRLFDNLPTTAFVQKVEGVIEPESLPKEAMKKHDLSVLVSETPKRIVMLIGASNRPGTFGVRAYDADVLLNNAPKGNQGILGTMRFACDNDDSCEETYEINAKEWSVRNQILSVVMALDTSNRPVQVWRLDEALLFIEHGYIPFFHVRTGYDEIPESSSLITTRLLAFMQNGSVPKFTGNIHLKYDPIKAAEYLRQLRSQLGQNEVGQVVDMFDR